MRRRNESLLDSCVDLISELPGPLRPVAGVAALGATINLLTFPAITSLKATKQPLPPPLDWIDAVTSLRWSAFQLPAIWLVPVFLLLGTLLLLPLLRPKSLYERHQARWKLRRQLGLPSEPPPSGVEGGG